MSSRRYHGELAVAFKPAAQVDNPWLDDATTTRYLSVKQRADAEIAHFWQAQDESVRRQITDRAIEPRWLRLAAVLIASLLCGSFARVLLSPVSEPGPQPSAATVAAPQSPSIADSKRTQAHPGTLPAAADDEPAARQKPAQR